MSRVGFVASVVLGKLDEFDRMASLLAMPSAERLAILNIAEETYVALRAGVVIDPQGIKPELDRRLSYALPLMRKLVSNASILRMPADHRLATA